MPNMSSRNIYAQPIRIAGEEYPAILSMKAIHEIEETLQEPFENVLNKLYAVVPDDGGCYMELEPKYFSAVLFSCLRAANEQLDSDKLVSDISRSDCFDVGLGLVDILTEQLPSNTAEYVKQDNTTEPTETGIDWRSMVYFATVHLKWTIEQFWNSTFFMYGAMLEQHLIYNGIKKNKLERKVAKTYEEWRENMSKS